MRSFLIGEVSSAARAHGQAARLAPWGLRTNGEMGPAATRATCTLSPAADDLLAALATRRALSAESQATSAPLR